MKRCTGKREQLHLAAEYVADDDSDEDVPGTEAGDIALGNIDNEAGFPPYGVATQPDTMLPPHLEPHTPHLEQLPQHSSLKGTCTALSPRTGHDSQQRSRPPRKERVVPREPGPPPAPLSYVTDKLDPSKPLILFDLNGVLVSERATGGAYRSEWSVRPGIAQLLLLLPRYQLGVFSSAKRHNVYNALRAVFSAVCAGRKQLELGQPQVELQPEELGARAEAAQDTLPAPTAPRGKKRRKVPPGLTCPEQLFSLVLSREHCQPDPTWTSRPDGKHWDTIKPLAGNGLLLGRVLLVDNEPRKVAAEELSSLVEIPTWEGCPDLGAASWTQLVNSLLSLPLPPSPPPASPSALDSSSDPECPPGLDPPPASPPSPPPPPPPLPPCNA
ncbi:hypothetical protein V8C86DRAFT_3152565 [Haematococcus lacustris]